MFVKKWIKALLPLFVVVAAFVMQWLGWVDWAPLRIWLTEQAGEPWLPVMLVALMIGMYMLALPASMLMLVAGLAYSPPWATTLTIIGGTLGALAAYAWVNRLSSDALESYSQHPVKRYLERHAGFLELCAIRTLPGFPHSVTNYASGLLRIPLPIFTTSCMLGFAIKGFVYTSAVHQIVDINTDGQPLGLSDLWPLLAMTLLFIAGAALKKFAAVRQ